MKYIFVLHIPVVWRDGKHWLPQLAAIDLLAHRRLLPDSVKLVLTAPLVEDLDEPLERLDGIEVVPLKFENSFGEGLRVLLPNWITLWQEIKKADLVHTGCGGWPFFFSPCFQAHLIALFQHKARIFVMDCDLVGKIEKDQIARTVKWWKKVAWQAYAKLAWWLFRFCLGTAGATFLLGRGVATRYGRYANNPLEIYQPIVGSEDLISNDQLQVKLSAVRSGQPLKAVFAGRLAHEKGVDILLQALKILQGKKIALEVDIIGDGPERAQLESLATELGVKVNFCGALPWGKQIFAKLREGHFFMIMHRTEEMTRTALEGPASGCAIVCSDTEAFKQLVRDSGGGATFQKGNAESLASVLSGLLEEREALVKLIENGISFFQTNHRDAHFQRRINFSTNTFTNLNWG